MRTLEWCNFLTFRSRSTLHPIGWLIQAKTFHGITSFSSLHTHSSHKPVLAFYSVWTTIQMRTTSRIFPLLNMRLDTGSIMRSLRTSQNAYGRQWNFFLMWTNLSGQHGSAFTTSTTTSTSIGPYPSTMTSMAHSPYTTPPSADSVAWLNTSSTNLLST